MRKRFLTVALTGLIGLLGLFPLASGSTAAEDSELVRRCTPQGARARVENTHMHVRDGEDTDSTVYTAQASNIAGDALKAYHHEAASDYSSIGLQTGRTTVHASVGDIEAAGVQASRVLGKTTVTANAERNSTKDATRLGGDVYRKMGRLTLGVGCDNNTSDNGTVNQGVGNARLDLSKDQFGVGYATDGTKHSSTGFWTHYGPKEAWGARNWVQATGTDADNMTVCADSIFAQNPTFSAASSPWLIGRERGDMYDTGVSENPFSPERCPLQNRGKGGVVGEVKGVRSTKDGKESAFVRTDLGYVFTGKLWKFGAVGGGQFDIKGNGADQYQGSILFSRGNSTLEVGVTHNTDADNTTGYVSLDTAF